MAPNLDAIKAGGIGPFIGEQGIRIDILKDLLARHNDGHSKNYYCLGCALLPLGTLQEIHALADTLPTTAGPKERCIVIRGAMAEASVYMEIDLRLHTKP